MMPGSLICKSRPVNVHGEIKSAYESEKNVFERVGQCGIWDVG